MVLRQNYKSVDIVVTLSPFPIQKEYPSSWMYVVVVVAGCNHRKFMIINHNPFSDWDVVYQCFITILCLFFQNVLVMKMLMQHIIMSQKSINEWYHRTVYNISFCPNNCAPFDILNCKPMTDSMFYGKIKPSTIN